MIFTYSTSSFDLIFSISETYSCWGPVLIDTLGGWSSQDTLSKDSGTGCSLRPDAPRDERSQSGTSEASCCSVTQLCPALHNPMDCSSSGFPVLHPFPGLCSDSCLLSQWCHPTISSSAALFSFCLQSFPESGSFPMSWLFTSNGPRTGVSASASASVLPMTIQGWFPLGLTSLISLLFKRLKESSPTPEFKRINSSVLSLLYDPTLTSVDFFLWKNHNFDYMVLCGENNVSLF